MTVEKMCWNCDVTFIVKLPKGHEVTYCPVCGEQLGRDDDVIQYDDE